jgi:histone deacetylase 6
LTALSGNGTQAAFYDDPDVLYVSLHRYDSGQFYPMGPAGSMHSVGEGAGEGLSVLASAPNASTDGIRASSLNVPWPQKGAGDAEYLHAFQRLIMPIAMEFSPELVISMCFCSRFVTAHAELPQPQSPPDSTPLAETNWAAAT